MIRSLSNRLCSIPYLYLAVASLEDELLELVGLHRTGSRKLRARAGLGCLGVKLVGLLGPTERGLFLLNRCSTKPRDRGRREGQKVRWVTGVWAEQTPDLVCWPVERWAPLRLEGQGGEVTWAVKRGLWNFVER